MVGKSTLGVSGPAEGKSFRRGVDEWLEDKRAIDDTEGLWRIHNGLYDFTRFITSHPGGEFWLKETKGTDITEAFESHHISTLPESLIKKYYVREATTPRASPFTFKDDGFYRTVKRNVREALTTIPKDDIKVTHMYSDGLIAGTFTFAVIGAIFWSYTFGVVSGILYGLTIVAAHNYSHQRDNFRMYYGDLCLQSTRDWRIVHVISHHMYTNSIADLQTFLLEPLINFYPEKKSVIVKYGNIIYQPLFMWTTRNLVLSIQQTYKLANCIRRAEKIKIEDILPFLLPLTMYLLGGQTFFWTIVMWEFVGCVGFFIFALVGTTGTHVHPDIFIDGDAARPAERDWGINQLDTVSDRYEVAGNHFLSLITFGDHALHHLFPTLDHGVIKHLYPVVEETIKQFDTHIRMTTHADMLVGYFRQIAREVPKVNPPGSQICY